jgi:hypothetical protein
MQDDRQRLGGLVRADLPAQLALGDHRGRRRYRRGHVLAEELGQAARVAEHVEQHPAAQGIGRGDLGRGPRHRGECRREDGFGVLAASSPAWMASA